MDSYRYQWCITVAWRKCSRTTQTLQGHEPAMSCCHESGTRCSKTRSLNGHAQALSGCLLVHLPQALLNADTSRVSIVGWVTIVCCPAIARWLTIDGDEAK